MDGKNIGDIIIAMYQGFGRSPAYPAACLAQALKHSMQRSEIDAYDQFKLLKLLYYSAVWGILWKSGYCLHSCTDARRADWAPLTH